MDEKKGREKFAKGKRAKKKGRRKNGRRKKARRMPVFSRQQYNNLLSHMVTSIERIFKPLKIPLPFFFYVQFGKYSSVTHSNREYQEKLEFYWEPPTNITGNETDVTFFATLAKNKNIYWVFQQSNTLPMNMEDVKPVKDYLPTTGITTVSVNNISVHHNAGIYARVTRNLVRSRFI
jgi:hypothetical protein